MGRAPYLGIVLACVGVLAACRINRGGTGPLPIDETRFDAGAHEPPQPAAADSSVPRLVDDPPASANDAGPATLEDAGSTLDAAAPPEPNDNSGCGKALKVDGCNPITNTGCPAELGMQCDVDLLAPTLSGQCVFSTPPADAGACLNIPPTESCPPRHTCVDFSDCKQLCTCDSDCDAGSCCDERLGEHGFKTCSPC
jgi:hypothetical protein